MFENITEKRKDIDVASEVMELKAMVNVILQNQARIVARLENKSDKDLIQEFYNEVAKTKQLMGHNLFGSK
jgi:hypothetical protein